MISANAADFRLRLHRCLFQEAPKIPKRLPPDRSDVSQEQQVMWLQQEELLEHHARTYIIDSILSALNWQIHHATDAEVYLNNLVPEVPLSGGRTTRFLDYLGLDRGTERPLLIVEAKRPAAKLPSGGGSEPDPKFHPAAKAFVKYLAGKVVRPSGPDGLTEEWKEYLDQVKNYAQRLTQEHAPKRVVLTNGDWMVVFRNPSGTFFPETATPSPGDIYIYSSKESMLGNAEEIFGLLAYGELSCRSEMIHVAEVAAFVDPKTVVACAFGLRVRHERHRPMRSSGYCLFPQLRVTPVLFLVSNKGTFLGLESSDEEGALVPREGLELEEHLNDISRSAHKLKHDFETGFALHPLPLTSVEAHYADAARFEARPGVVPLDSWGLPGGRPIDRDAPSPTNDRRGGTFHPEFVLFTGRDTHFLTRDEAFTGCPYHAYAAATKGGEGCDHGPIGKRSVEPRSLFVDGNTHHCAHQHILLKKRLPVVKDNRSLYGQRSAKDHGAFCEIWGFEQHMCCRACVYRNVCTAAQVFVALPCKTHEGASDPGVAKREVEGARKA